MALSGHFMRRILGGGGGFVSRRCFVESRRQHQQLFMRVKSTLTSPRLFIDGLSALTTDEKIKEAFAPFGNLVEAKVIRDRASGRSNGFAIVTYDTIEEAEKALKGMNNRRLDGYVVPVEPREFEPSEQKHACPKYERTVLLNIYDFAELERPLSLTSDDKLKEAFAPFGNVVEAKIYWDRSMGRSKAIVRYDTKEEALKARKALYDDRLVEPKEFKPSEHEPTSSGTSYTTTKTGGLYTQSRHYYMEAEAEAEGGNYTSKDEMEIRSIKKGDIISLKDLLFTRNRDYLVKNNNEHVKAEQLEGKVIVLYFLPLRVDRPEYSTYYTSLLKDVYYDLLPNNKFEVVLVSVNCRNEFKRKIVAHPSRAKDPQKHFEDLFSSMPWTAIPYSDVVSRKCLHRSFGGGLYEEYPSLNMFVVDSTGMVLQCGDWDVFQDFGASGYPFSDERLGSMRAEDDAAAKQPSLKTLLASPERDYVLSNKGDKVSIHTLEDKVVALYLYHVDVPNDFLTEKLKFAYKELAKINKKFEVVLVYITESHRYGMRCNYERSYWKELKTMPWLALPFRDECCKKLRRVFKISVDGEDDPNKIVIIGPHAEFIEPFGANILLRYDISAYPFTCNKAVEFEIEKIKELKLEMLWDPNTVFTRNNGSQVPFSELSGKRVMLVLEMINSKLAYCEGSPYAEFFMMLKGRYLQTKGTDDEFEVIRILLDNMEFSTGEHLDLRDESCLVSLAWNLGDMHWILCLASELKHNLGSSDFWYGMSIDESVYLLPVLAFDRDGRLVRKTLTPTFKDIKFPFCAGGLEEGILSHLTTPIILEWG